jgi:hypothetical protein
MRSGASQRPSSRHRLRYTAGTAPGAGCPGPDSTTSRRRLAEVGDVGVHAVAILVECRAERLGITDPELCGASDRRPGRAWGTPSHSIGATNHGCLWLADTRQATESTLT